jgi:transcriptional regulator with XRE-family HTH domain
MKGTAITTTQAISRNLKTLLDRHGLSHNQLAKKAGVSQSYVSAIVKEDGKPVSVEVLDKLAKPFGLQGWQLAMPNLPPDLLESDLISKVVRGLADANDEGRTLIARTVEREARFNKLPAPDDSTT